ncbi:MAG: phasin family protein [Betaproteobacteria bacterium]|nr:TIGR01841 family phasin [Betaproteobacteria bacterium]MDE2423883.1 phasin family protein [Betaproteobacteria bacterium]
MAATPEQMLKVQQENLERLLSLSKVLLDSTEKVSHASLGAVKQHIESLHEQATRLANAKTPQEWYQIQMDYLKPSGNNAQEHVTKTYEISKETAQEVATIIQNQVEDFNKKVSEAFSETLKSMPQGSEPMTAAFNSLMAAGNNAYASAQKAFKQVVELAENNAKNLSQMNKL